MRLKSIGVKCDRTEFLKLNFYFYFGKFVTKHKAFGNNTIFYNNFFGFGRGGVPLATPLRSLSNLVPNWFLPSLGRGIPWGAKVVVWCLTLFPVCIFICMWSSSESTMQESCTQPNTFQIHIRHHGLFKEIYFS